MGKYHAWFIQWYGNLRILIRQIHGLSRLLAFYDLVFLTDLASFSTTKRKIDHSYRRCQLLRCESPQIQSYCNLRPKKFGSGETKIRLQQPLSSFNRIQLKNSACKKPKLMAVNLKQQSFSRIGLNTLIYCHAYPSNAQYFDYVSCIYVDHGLLRVLVVLLIRLLGVGVGLRHVVLAGAARVAGVGRASSRVTGAPSWVTGITVPRLLRVTSLWVCASVEARLLGVNAWLIWLVADGVLEIFMTVGKRCIVRHGSLGIPFFYAAVDDQSDRDYRRSAPNSDVDDRGDRYPSIGAAGAAGAGAEGGVAGGRLEVARQVPVAVGATAGTVALVVAAAVLAVAEDGLCAVSASIIAHYKTYRFKDLNASVIGPQYNMKSILIGALAVFAHSQMAGGYTQVNLQDLQEREEFGQVESLAEQKLAKLYHCDEVQTSSVQTQVVSGMNYKLEMKALCREEESEFEVVVYSQPWTNTLTVTSIIKK